MAEENVMKLIGLTQGKFAKVNDEDFDYLSKWKWYFGGHGYAVRTVNHSKKVYMHRLLLNVPRGKEIDHKNMDRLDNRRDNIRVCTPRENQLNRWVMRKTISGYKGVYFRKRYQKKWAVYIDRKFYGGYESKIDAARKYNEVVTICHGEYARLNVI